MGSLEDPTGSPRLRRVGGTGGLVEDDLEAAADEVAEAEGVRLVLPGACWRIPPFSVRMVLQLHDRVADRADDVRERRGIVRHRAAAMLGVFVPDPLRIGRAGPLPLRARGEVEHEPPAAAGAEAPIHESGVTRNFVSGQQTPSRRCLLAQKAVRPQPIPCCLCRPHHPLVLSAEDALGCPRG